MQVRVAVGMSGANCLLKVGMWQKWSTSQAGTEHYFRYWYPSLSAILRDPTSRYYEPATYHSTILSSIQTPTNKIF